MALRVLLADESSTIKKAIQLVLSEYGVEVKTVPTGIDVLSVTRSFIPDIIIADVLLNKKNGYEVCQELKSHADTKDIPVILMWSNFMQLNDQLYKNSGADASLEKPFDSDTVRKLIENLVPKLMSFPLRGLLNHAPLPDFEESDTFIKQKNTINTLIKPESASESSFSGTPATFVIDEPVSFQNTDTQGIAGNYQGSKLNFKQKLQQKQQELSESEQKLKPVPPSQKSETPPENEEWSSSKTNQFVIETENYGDFEEVKVINSRNRDTSDLPNLDEQIQSYINDSPLGEHRSQPSSRQKNVSSSFDQQLMREEIRQITERICWQLIPEITERIVREELAKLLQGIEKNL